MTTFTQTAPAKRFRFRNVRRTLLRWLVFLPLLMAWLYLSWCCILFGAALAGAADDVTGHRKPTVIPPQAG